jgi:hypothetical protein
MPYSPYDIDVRNQLSLVILFSSVYVHVSTQLVWSSKCLFAPFCGTYIWTHTGMGPKLSTE